MKISDFTDKNVTESLSDDFSDQYSDSSFRFRPLRPPLSSPNFQIRRDDDARSSIHEELISVINSVINRRMEECFNSVLRAVESLNVRLSQLETRSRKIEDSVTEIKDLSTFNHGRTEQKLKELENVLTEVQGGVRDLRDKQVISEVQIQMAKLQLLKSNQKSKERKTKVKASHDQPVISSSSSASIEPQSNQSHPNLNVRSQRQYHSHTNTHQIPTYQNLPPPVPLPKPISQNQNQPPQPISSAAYQPYQPYLSPNVVDPQTRHLFPVTQHQHQHPQHLHNLHNHVAQEAHYLPTHNLGGNPYTPFQTYDHGSYKDPTFLPDYAEASLYSGFLDDYARYGHTSQPPLSELRLLSSVLDSNNRFSQLPKAKELPRALPMVSEVDSGSGFGRTGNSNARFDDVVGMEFQRDLMRAS